jgi:ornithine carbamoyltransferase
MRHALSLREFTGDELAALVDDAIRIKERPDDYANACKRKGLLILMQKTSTRTTLSFSAAIAQMGGYAIKLEWAESNFSISPIRHEARYVSRNCDAIMARLRTFEDLDELARNSEVPVINGCCTRYHPSQAIADLITVREVLGRLEGASLAYVGIHNNVANSLVVACSRVGIRINLVTPLVNEPAWDEELMEEARATGLVSTFDSLVEAAAVSDFVYTDTWVDMEFFTDPDYAEERERRIALMKPYQVNRENLGGASPYIMHDMPIHPGYEIAEEMIEAPASVIYQQAENRLYAAKTLLRALLAGS